jgi:hypothetical protein
MASSHCVYNRYSDNVAPAATITVPVGTVATGYQASWVADYDASRPLKLNETTGEILFDHGSAVEIAIVAFFHCNFVEGLHVHVKRGATTAAASIDVDITIPAWHKGRFPPQPWRDLRAVTGHGAYRYTRITVPSANSVKLSFGDIWLGTAFRTFNLQDADKPTTSRPQIEHSTDFRKQRFSLGYTTRSWTGTSPASNLKRDELVDWILDADGRPVLFIPEHSVTPAEAWLALHGTTAQQVNQTFDEANFLPIQIDEDGRGLEPTPSPLA